MNTQAALPKSEADVEVGERVAEALIVKRVTVKAMAAELGLSYSTMRRTLGGERSFTIRQLRHVANTLSISPAALLPHAVTEADAA
jgi:transcriptional regulator with XRE-family HTH domain